MYVNINAVARVICVSSSFPQTLLLLCNVSKYYSISTKTNSIRDVVWMKPTYYSNLHTGNLS